MIRTSVLREMFADARAPDGTLARENFARWFGDSKTVDAAGRPLVVYHGTAVTGTTFDARHDALPAGAFDRFLKSKRGLVSGSSDSKVGFWFSADPDRAQSAAADAMSVLGWGHSPYVYCVFLSLRRPLVVHDSLRAFDPADSARLIRRATRERCDGVIFRQGEGRAADFVVFGTQQIKSATANCGAFSPTDPSITDARALQVTRALQAKMLLRRAGRAMQP